MPFASFPVTKMDYMHSNPVVKNWSLVKEPGDYVHSSAGYYLTGKQGIYEVMNTNDWINEN